ncbi:hypothetical protein N0V90_000871 [Kalmusia sp. IMI 367209]|nr:hypothetical protein N0V90_000871 [Kalmusia sp. IMI 367209]
MVGRRVQRPLWRLACALFATVASAGIAPSNTSTGIDYGGTINLQEQESSTAKNITTLVPLTTEATIRNLNGELYLTNDNNYGLISGGDLAFISCDAQDYPGNLQADNIFQSVYDSDKPSGAILFSTESNYCNYTGNDASIKQFPIYSMTSKAASQNMKDTLMQQSASTKFFARVTTNGTADGSQQDQSQGSNTQQQNPLGPSPSTAVAMIILYSITGVITALFLVIIVTGAVRAHRHPDRYGPRDVMGRPRQSRARGLGMAILDTIPIVKFGEREQPKPADVELGSTSEARDVTAADADTTAAATETRNDATTEVPREIGTEHAEGLDSGIAPAQPVAGAAVTQANSSADEGLGCSICTDDFEKGQDIRVLPCNHKFHPECVDPWLLNVSGTCPLCRVDLRPVTSHTSTESHSEDPDALAPPLQSDTDASHRRHSTLRDILSFRSRPNASADERISALRRLREQRRNQSGEMVVGSANTSSDDVARDRRNKRMSVRLSDVFSGRRRGGREDSPEMSGPSSSQSPRRDESPRPDGSSTSPEASNNQNSRT